MDVPTFAAQLLSAGEPKTCQDTPQGFFDAPEDLPPDGPRRPKTLMHRRLWPDVNFRMSPPVASLWNIFIAHAVWRVSGLSSPGCAEEMTAIVPPVPSQNVDGWVEDNMPPLPKGSPASLSTSQLGSVRPKGNITSLSKDDISVRDSVTSDSMTATHDRPARESTVGDDIRFLRQDSPEIEWAILDVFSSAERRKSTTALIQLHWLLHVVSAWLDEARIQLAFLCMQTYVRFRMRWFGCSCF